MRESWRSARVGELVVQVKEPVKLLPGKTYKLLGVRWYGNGPFIRETVTSETSKATRLFPVQAGDFIYNRLFAWKGSFGLITKELEGCFVSSEFPLFHVRQDQLDAKFLNLIMCQPSKLAQIEVESTGSTSVSRNRWKEDRFTEQNILLPQLNEQKRIVDLVEAADGYIDALQQQAITARVARNAVLHELLFAGADDWTEIPLSSVLELNNKKLGPGKEEPEIFAISKHDGVVLAQEYFDRRVASKSLDGYKVIGPGDWVYSTIHIDEGSIAVNHFPFQGVVSPMYTSMIWSSQNHDSRFFELLLKSDKALMKYQEFAQGTVNRRRSLSWSTFSNLTFNVPPLEEQRRIVQIVATLDEVIHATEMTIVEAKNMRSGLLTDLLTGNHEIPASYDALVRVA